MSDKVTVIYQRILDLSETNLEGLKHIQSMAMDGRFEETVTLYTDVANAMCEIQSALEAVYPDYEQSDLKNASERVVESMKLVLAAYEGEKDVRPMEVLQFAMLPTYNRWYDILQEELRETCASQMH